MFGFTYKDKGEGAKSSPLSFTSYDAPGLLTGNSYPSSGLHAVEIIAIINMMVASRLNLF